MRGEEFWDFYFPIIMAMAGFGVVQLMPMIWTLIK